MLFLKLVQTLFAQSKKIRMRALSRLPNASNTLWWGQTCPAMTGNNTARKHANTAAELLHDQLAPESTASDSSQSWKCNHLLT